MDGTFPVTNVIFARDYVPTERECYRRSLFLWIRGVLGVNTWPVKRPLWKHYWRWWFWVYRSQAGDGWYVTFLGREHHLPYPEKYDSTVRR